MKEKLIQAKFYKKLKDNKVGCELCNHFCLIAEGNTGICRVRKNIKGELYCLVYGAPAAINVDPVEKKPLYHFLPGSRTFSLGTFGCNFRCKNCHNYEISQADIKDVAPEFIEPEAVVAGALKASCPSISYTYNEPTVFAEYALDIMRLAAGEGLKNIWVSNGFTGRAALKEIIPFLDAVNVDLKSMDDGFYREVSSGRLEPVLENLKFFYRAGVHLEITTLIIPTLSDDPKMLKRLASFIFSELGADVPWHLSRFSPEISWKLKHLPETDLEALKKAYDIGKKAGLKYVYAGDLVQDTHCPACGAPAIERNFYKLKRYDKKGRCGKCGSDLSIKE